MAGRGTALAITVCECRHRKALKEIAAFPGHVTLAEVFEDPDIHPPFEKGTNLVDVVVAKGSTDIANFDGTCFDLDLSLQVKTIVETFKVVAVKFVCSPGPEPSDLLKSTSQNTKNAFDLLMASTTTRALPQKKTKR